MPGGIFGYSTSHFSLYLVAEISFVCKILGMSADRETRGTIYASVRMVCGQQTTPSSLGNDSKRDRCHLL